MRGSIAVNSPVQGFSGLDIQFARFLARVSGDGSPELLFAAALVSSARGKGNVCVDLFSKQAANEISEFAAFDSARLITALQKSPAVGRPGEYKPLIFDGSRLYLYRYWEYEDSLFRQVSSRAACLIEPDRISMKEKLFRLFPSGSLGQKKAAAIAALKPFTVITGGPGTGKTSIVARTMALLNELSREQPGPAKPLRAALAAPTGKAAARLQESIRLEIGKIDCPASVRAAIPIEASTVHRLLGWGSRGFRYNRENTMNLDLLVIDEASMVDMALLSRLVQALPAECRLMLLGDRDQLASVEAGAVLGDICGSEARDMYSPEILDCLNDILAPEIFDGGPPGPIISDCIARLNYSFRFGPSSQIGDLSRAVNIGNAGDALGACIAGDKVKWLDLPQFGRIASELSEYVLDFYSPVMKAKGPEEALEKLACFRILCAVREGPYGISGINATAREILYNAGLITSEGRYYKGLPVMVTSNNYNLDLYNGDVGIIWPDLERRHELRAFFYSKAGMRSLPLLSLPAHETVYAMTVHKSQGSEFDRVLFIMPERDTPLLTRELIYTAVTRTREQVVIWGKKDIFRAALSQEN